MQVGNILKRKRGVKARWIHLTPNAWCDHHCTHYIFFFQIRDSKGVLPLFVGSVTAWMICPPGFIKAAKLMSLLHPFRNHWWSLTIWLALSSAINSRIALFSALNRAFSPANERGTLNQNNQPDFKACLMPRTNEIAGRWKAKNRKPLCGEFCNFCSKILLYISFGCPGDKVVIEVSRVQFVVVVVGLVYWNELNSQRISLQQKNGTHV